MLYFMVMLGAKIIVLSSYLKREPAKAGFGSRFFTVADLVLTELFRDPMR